MCVWLVISIVQAQPGCGTVWNLPVVQVGTHKSQWYLEVSARHGGIKHCMFIVCLQQLRHLSLRRRRQATQSSRRSSSSETVRENPGGTADATVIGNEDGEPCSPLSVQSGSKLQRSESYHIALEGSEVEADMEQSQRGQTGNKLHTIIVDCSAISFVDSIGVDELEQVRHAVWWGATHTYACTHTQHTHDLRTCMHTHVHTYRNVPTYVRTNDS